MKTLIFLLIPFLCFAQQKDAATDTDSDSSNYLYTWSYGSPNPLDYSSNSLSYEYGQLEAQSKGKYKEDWRDLKKGQISLAIKAKKYENFVERRARVTKLKDDDVKNFLNKGIGVTSRGMDETTMGFNIRTKVTQSDIKSDGIEILSTLKKDLRNLKRAPDLPDKIKQNIEDQIKDIDRQEKEWRERKWYGPSDLTPEKIEKLQKEIQMTSARARAINMIWETHQKNLKADLEASIKANNDAKARLSGGVLGPRGAGGSVSGQIGFGPGGAGGIDGSGTGGIGIGGRGPGGIGGVSGIGGRGPGGIGGVGGSFDGSIGSLTPAQRDALDRKTRDFNLSLGDLFRKGELADINGDFAFRNLNDWARKLGKDVKDLQTGLRTNDEFMASMKNTPMGIFVDSQIAKAFEDLCNKVRACMIQDPHYLLKESLKGINDSSRGPSDKEFIFSPAQRPGPSVKEK